MYKYEVWYDGAFLHEENRFEDDDDAFADGELYVDSRLDNWEEDGVITPEERKKEMEKFNIYTSEE